MTDTGGILMSGAPGSGKENMSEENKAIVRRLVEAVFCHGGNPNVIDELLAPTFVRHDPSSEAGEVTREGVKGSIGWIHAAFPDLYATVEDQVAEGNTVASRWVVSGTHQGQLMGETPTGKRVTFTGITIDRFSEGRIQEGWVIWDALGFMQQIGAIPEPRESKEAGLT